MMGGNYSSLHRAVALPTGVRAEHLDVRGFQGNPAGNFPIVQ